MFFPRVFHVRLRPFGFSIALPHRRKHIALHVSEGLCECRCRHEVAIAKIDTPPLNSEVAKEFAPGEIWSNYFGHTSDLIQRLRIENEAFITRDLPLETSLRGLVAAQWTFHAYVD